MKKSIYKKQLPKSGFGYIIIRKNFYKEDFVMLEITSSSNPKYKYIKSLSSKKERIKSGEYTVEGKKSVSDALLSDRFVSMIAVSDDFYENEDFEYPEGVVLLKVNSNIFDKLCDTTAPQGIIAVIKIESKKDFVPDINKAYVYCDGINDPGNLGTIIRTADAAGFGGVILSKGTVDLYSPKTVRSSMGSFFNIEVVTDKDVSDLKKYKEMGFTLFGGALRGDTKDYRSVDMTKPSIIVVGNEANGISDAVIDICDCVKIPISGRAESLNVSVAAGILMYELVRQRS